MLRRQPHTGNADVFIGSAAGNATTTGNGDVYIGYLSGPQSATAAYNTFVGADTGYSDITEAHKTFLGFNAGDYNATGQQNTLLGDSAGQGNSTGSDDIYINNPGANNESNTISIGDPANQNAASIAGIYGGSVSSGQPVHVDGTRPPRHQRQRQRLPDRRQNHLQCKPGDREYHHRRRGR